MQFASAIQCPQDAAEGVRALLKQVEPIVPFGEADFAVFFTTAHFEEDAATMLEALRTAYPQACLIGCSAEGAIGAGREVERRPAMSILVAQLPGVELRPFILTQPQVAAAMTSGNYESFVGVSPEALPTFFALADPFRVDVQGFVEGLNEAYPASPLFGGIASAARQPGENLLICGDDVLREGLVGVAMTGDVRVSGVVSQGCRPIGRPLLITRCDGRVINELGGKPAFQQLVSMYNELDEGDQERAQEALFVGRVIDEYKEEFRRGDFLIQNVMGLDRKTGALAIAGDPRVGATIQFHVRDADCADEDLRTLLSTHADAEETDAYRGALLFNCNGRGTRMWPNFPDHDARVLSEFVGDIPVAGFFCAGEFGPVGGRNFIHGFTASIALFSRPDDGA